MDIHVRLLTLVLTGFLAACASSMNNGAGGDYPVVQITPAVIAAEKAGETGPAYTAASTKMSAYQYTIAPGDVLDYTVWDRFGSTTELESGAIEPRPSKVTVENNGDASFAIAGTLHLQGLTVADARALLDKVLHRYFNQPQFSLDLAEFHGHTVTISGAVAKPGVQSLTYTPLTLPKALEAAGGPLPAADLEHSEVIHGNGMHETVNIDALLYHGDISQDRVLTADDTLLIPQNNRNRIFVMGEVNKPQSEYIVGGKLTLTEALTEAGSLNAISSSSEHIYVVRNAIPDTAAQPAAMTPVVYQLDGSSPVAFALADQFDLKPRDVVYVGTAPVTQWQRFMAQLIPPSVSYAASMTH